MYSFRKPILFNTPIEQNEITVYLSSDIHRGSEQFDARKWSAFARLLEAQDAYVIFVGDQMENATRSGKSDVYGALRPHEEKEWWKTNLRPFASKIIALIDGNHEARSTKDADAFPLYDIALALDIEDRYRSEAAFVDIGVGQRRPSQNRQWHYFGYIVHKAQNLMNFGTADAIDGIDFFVSGHTHKAMDKPLPKLSYDSVKKSVSIKEVENIVSGSFLKYGGYAARAGMRPGSGKLYKLILSGKGKSIQTVGFYV